MGRSHTRGPVRRNTIAVVLMGAALCGGPPRAQAQTDSGVEVPGAVSVDLTLEYYEVGEPTLDRVIDRLNRTRLEGPDAPPSQGLTRYQIVPNWSARAGGGVCRAHDVGITVAVTITLPTWSEVDSRPDREQSGWEAIESAIRDHEFVHRDLTLQAGLRLLDELQGIEARGCGTLSRVIDSRVSIEDDRLRRAHAELDRSTPRRLPVG